MIFYLYHLKTIRVRIVVGVDGDGVETVHFGPAFHARNDGVVVAYFGIIFDRADEFAADDAFVNEPVAFFQFALGGPLRHARRGARAAGRAVDGLVAVKNGIAGRGGRVNDRARPFDVAEAVDGGVVGVNEGVFFVDALAQYARPTDELFGFIMLQPREIRLHIDDGVKITSVGHVHFERAEVRAFGFNAFGGKVGGHIDELNGFDFVAFLYIADQHQARRRFHAHDAGCFGANETMLNGDGDGADGAVAAHGQAAAGFDKQYRYVVFGVVGRVQNTARHHVVAARFKHQTFANPVVFAEKMLAFFAHVAAFKNGAAARYNAYGIAAGMGINAEKSFGRHGKWIK